MPTKSTLRIAMLTQLKIMTAAQHESRSAKIIQRLMATKEFQIAETIAVTMSNFPEVQTRQFIEACWILGKTIAVPKSEPNTKTMTFYKLTSFDDLEVVFAGIEEPIEARCQKQDKSRIDLVIVPGVVFTKTGYRIGFGGGFYDRFLADFHKDTIALAFDEQIQPEIPIDTYDLPVQKIVTDKQILNCLEE